MIYIFKCIYIVFKLEAIARLVHRSGIFLCPFTKMCLYLDIDIDIDIDIDKSNQLSMSILSMSIARYIDKNIGT